MIRLKDLLHEVLTSKDSYTLDKDIVSANKKVQKFIEDNFEELEKLIADDDFKTIYQMAFKNIQGVDQLKLIQALNNSLNLLTTGEPFIVYPDENDSFDIDETSTTWEVGHEVSKWVKRNRKKLLKLADDDNYKEFYELAKKQFPKAQEWKLMLAVNQAAIKYDIHYEYHVD